jgi:hypothetical protein
VAPSESQIENRKAEQRLAAHKERHARSLFLPANRVFLMRHESAPSLRHRRMAGARQANHGKRPRVAPTESQIAREKASRVVVLRSGDLPQIGDEGVEWSFNV